MPRRLTLTLTEASIERLIDAIDSHVYWQLSDPSAATTAA